MARALVIGRFQPLHKGHVKLIKLVLKECSKVYIVIGSSQLSGIKDNPFSLEERQLMIKSALLAENIRGYGLFVLEDVKSNNEWVEKLLKLVPKFDAFYTAGGITAALLRKKGFKVKSIKKFDGISATRIRQMIKKGDDNWKRLVPEAVAKIVDKKQARQRIALILHATRRTQQSS